METSIQHFAEDPEALEEFVLGRLDTATQRQFEEHLRSCDACRQAVTVERLIAAGIKRAGRERMMQRIGMLTGMPASRRIPWPHVLSVAAVLAILIGVGITQRWFVTHVEPTEMAKLESQPLDQKQTLDSPERPKIKEDRAEPAPAVHAAHAGSATRETERAKSLRDSKTKGGAENHGFDQMTANRLEEAPAEVEKDKRRADYQQPSLAAAPAQQEFWTNGTLLSEARSPRASSAPKADEGRVVGSTLSGNAYASKSLKKTTESLGRVMLDQRPASALPANQQSQQQLYSRQTIQTLVRQSDNETQLTLYPESPFDSTQLHYATVQQVGADSLVVQIGGQRIGYRFPSGTMMQRQTETSRQKNR